MFASPSELSPDFAAVCDAQARIRGVVHRTPLVTCSTLDHMAGRRLFFKCEHLQRAGAFKFRGASNAVMKLADAIASRGVATHSSGNHAGALALAARIRHIPAHIVMPSNASPVTVGRFMVLPYGPRKNNFSNCRHCSPIGKF